MHKIVEYDTCGLIKLQVVYSHVTPEILMTSILFCVKQLFCPV